MKMYKESFKRLAAIGLPLAAITLIYTMIVGAQDCFGKYIRTTATSAIGMTPVLVYYVFSAVLFALYGFSYLFKRSASDVYHGLPVRRSDLYLSNLAATATWMGGTVVLNVVVIWLLQVISGCPFVPLYVPMNILFFFVAAMLVYAAAAIGCALSGTLLTALASTGVVLFLPRFIQFIMARGIVANVPIIGWLDLDALLNPMSNIATGLLVMQVRTTFISKIVSMPNILFSMLIMMVELGLGYWLFIRRHSEAADRGSGRKIWGLITASLLSIAALMLITVDNKELLSMYGLSITAIAFLTFLIYQLVATRTIKQILVSIPIFVLCGAAAFGLASGISSLSSSMLNTTPAANEIASITFRGHDYRAGETEYTTQLLRKIDFTDDEIKKFVSENLADAVDKLNNPESAVYDSYSPFTSIEPITITLNNGQIIKRTIELANSNKLNDLRSKNEVFATSIRTFPTLDSLQLISVASNTFTKEENRAIWESYVAETQNLGMVVNSTYEKHDVSQSYGSSISYSRGDEQTFQSISAYGYVADQRFADYYTIRLATPKTASLLMRTYNLYSKADSTTRLWDAVKHMASPLALENDNFGLDLSFYNVSMPSGKPAQIGVNIYVSGYSKESDSNAGSYLDFAEKFTEIIKRGTPTDSTDKIFLSLSWYEYDSSNRESKQEPTTYLSFTPEDEKELQTLIFEWQSFALAGY